MRISVNVSTKVRPASARTAESFDAIDSTSGDAIDAHTPQSNRPIRILAGLALLAGCLFLLWIQFGFAQYAFTGFRWIDANGTVLDAHTTSSPTIEFITADGATHTFREDYYLVCGRRSFCIPRDFAPSQVVPIVYDPSTPQHAFVHDWALYSNTILWFVEAGITLVVILMLIVSVRRKPLNFSLQLGGQASQ